MINSRRFGSPFLGAIFVFTCLSLSLARAEEGKSGLSANRLKLPKGPGSLEGVGEDAEINPNMGVMNYKVPIALPTGFNSFSPSLVLSYSSTGGMGEVGMGWKMNIPMIERMTSRGLPEYTSSDFISADGEELVLVQEEEGHRVYRARFEKGFARYHWFDEANDGERGYWMVESPDGRVSFFGANSNGEIIEEARIESETGTFCYMLVEKKDALGHRILFQYQKEEEEQRPYLAQIQWAFENEPAARINDAGNARYEVAIEYEERPDSLMDGKPGILITLNKRIRNIRVLVQQQQLRSYHLGYESENSSGGLSRLHSVSQFGLNDEGPYPIQFSFQYSDALHESDAQRVSLGSIGVDMADGKADFNDFNGDGLPDIVHTPDQGPHQLFLQTTQQQGGQTVLSFDRFSESVVSRNGGLLLSSPTVHMSDIDGDGKSDMLDTLRGLVLWNGGQGDWGELEELGEGVIPEMRDNSNQRFMDVNHDRLIDMIHMERGASWYFKNLGEGRFDVATDLQNAPEGSFLDNGYQFSDMNGDGMVDLVQPLRAGFVAYWPNLGNGQFGRAFEMFFEDNPAVPLDAADTGILEQNIQYTDLNGDGLSDALGVQDGEILYALNRSGRGFRGWQRIIKTGDGQALPPKDGSVTIRLADMNGSGTSDIVYIDASGHVQYVELFAEKPHLLTRIENGIGKVIDVKYESTVEQWLRLQDEERANHDVPHPMIVVHEISTWESSGTTKDTRRFMFKHGYFDGVEHQFRGFENVEVVTEGDAYTETGTTLHRFDVGKEDVYRKGLALETTERSGEKVLSITSQEYDDCEVWTKERVPLPQQVRFVPYGVRHVCQFNTQTVIQEGRSEDQWAEIRSRTNFDGYGNVIEKTDWGIVSLGGQTCEPCADGRDPSLEQGIACGQECRGDEKTEIMHYIAPGQNTADRWFTKLVDEKRIKGHPESPATSLEYLYYDGPAFVGLERGQATQGILKRKSALLTENNRTIDIERISYDSHGNIVAMKDANENLRTFVMDENGLWLRAETVHLDDYDLRMTIAEYHEVLEKPLQTTTWNRIEGGIVQDELRLTSYQYDSFGRLVSLAKPDDLEDQPTQTFQYDLGNPISRIIIQQKVSYEDDSPTLQNIQCFDGRGRSLQTKVKLSEREYQSQGLSVFGKGGKVIKIFQPFVSESDECEQVEPDTVLFSEQTYDAQGRTLEVRYPDENIYGSNSVMKKVYGPLSSQAWDPEDNDPNSQVHFETPTTTFSNGIGQMTHLTFLKSRDEQPLTIRIGYDAFGRLSKIQSPERHIKTQRYDLLGRILETLDPDRGSIVFEYDDVGNVLSRTDARGISTYYSYDRANRITAQWNPLQKAETKISWGYDQIEQSPGFDDSNEQTCGDEPCRYLTGQLAQIRYPLLEGEENALERLGYDKRGRLRVRAFYRGGQTYLTKASYDAADRTTHEEFPAEIDFQYAYDGGNRLVHVSSILENMAYDEQNLVSAKQHINGITTFFAHDERLLLSNISTVSSESRAWMDLTYSRNRKGHILQVEDRSDFNPELAPPFTENAVYQYDGLDRLVRASLEINADKEEALTFQYSDDGNLLQKRSSFGERSSMHLGYLRYPQMSQPHAVIQVGDFHFAYDDAGYLLEQDGSPEGRIFQHWNHLGQLIETTKDNQSIVKYAYNHDGERAVKWEEGKRVEYLSPQIEVRDGIVSVFVKSGGKIIAKVQSKALAHELLPDVAPLALQNEGSFAIEPNALINSADAWVLFGKNEDFDGFEQFADGSFPDGTIGVESVLQASVVRLLFGEQEKLVTHYHHNHLGSTALTTDENGEALSRTYYYPYGQVRSKDGGLPDYNFTGKERDKKTGLSYHSARYLNPLSAAWVSADPHYATLGNPTLKSPWEAINPFAYTVGNPINLHDPSGKWSSKDIFLLFDDVHQMAIVRALHPEVDYPYIQIMQQAQHDIDRTELQTNAEQFRHSMRGRGQSKENAIQQANTFIRSRLSEAVEQWKSGNKNEAYYHVGLAIHTMQDASSPEHRGFKEWDEDASIRDQASHVLGENSYPSGKEKALLEGGTKWIHDLFKAGIQSECNDQSCYDGIDFFDSESGEAMVPNHYLSEGQ